MDVQQMIGDVREALAVKRVFGEPYERNGVTFIPAASVSGGGGGGGDNRPEGGAGGGFGVKARPAGAYVIRDGDVTWQPAFDLNAAVCGGQLIALIALLVLRSLVKSRNKRRARSKR